VEDWDAYFGGQSAAPQAKPETDWDAYFGADAGVSPPMSGWSPDQVAELNARKPAPDTFLQDQLGRITSLDPTEWGAAAGATVGRIGEKLGLLDEGEGKGEKFGRAAVDSLGPAGMEFAPLHGRLSPKAVGAPELRDASLQDRINTIPQPKQPISVGSKAATPTPKELHDQARGLYRQVENSGVVIRPERFGELISGIADDLNKGRLNTDIPLTMPNAQRVLKTLAAESGKQPNLANFQTYEDLATDLLNSQNKAEARVGGIILKRLEDFQRTLTETDLVGTAKVAPSQAFVMKKQADTLWGRYRKSQTLNELMERAINRVGANYNQAGLDTALRQEYKNLANSPKQRKWFSEQEMEAVLKVVRGDRWQQFVRNVGRFAPRGPVSGGVMGAVGVTAPAFVIPAWLTAEVAKAASTRKTLKNVDEARKLVATGGDTLKTLLSPQVHSHLSRNKRVAELMKRWAMDGGSVNASRILAVAIAKELKVPDLVPRIMQELQGTKNTQAQPDEGE
jgi:hypothetical protein